MATSSFYGQISANKRNSFLLAAGVIAIFAVLGLAIGYAIVGSVPGAVGVMALALAVGVDLRASAAISAATSWSSRSAARAPVDEATAPQLMNVVREMAIAANVPMPAVYVIDDTAPNAFATGRDPAHASIAITTGLLEKLDREELQGVIGHELSHVRNLDIRFSLDRRGHGRGDRDPGRLLPALHVLGRHVAAGARTATAAAATGSRR